MIQSGNETAERIRAGLAESSSASKSVSDFVLNIAEHVELSDYAAANPLRLVARQLEKNIDVKIEKLWRT